MNKAEIAKRCADAMMSNDRATKQLGMSVSINDAGAAEAVFDVRDDMLNGHGVCHGGLIFSLADTAFAFACNGYDRVTLAAGASIDFLRPAKTGERLTAVAREIHRGGRSGVYDVIVTNQNGDRIALFRGRSHATSAPILAQSDT